MGEPLAVVRLRLDVDDESRRVLDSQSRKCNWLYNRLVARARALHGEYCETQSEAACRTLYTKHGLRDLVPDLKKEHPFLKTVHSSPLKNTALRLTEAIQAYQKGRKEGGKARGWPKFRSWRAKWFSLFYDEPKKGLKLRGKRLRLSLGVDRNGKRGFLKLGLEDVRALKGKKIHTVRIVCQARVFYAVFTVERRLPAPKPIRKIIALDPNHRNLAYGVGSDGKAVEIESPWWLKAYDKRIDELKAMRDRCQRRSRLVDVVDDDGNATGRQYWKPSRRWEKLDATLQRALAKRRDQTKTFVYTVANRLLREYDLIAIGDYAPTGGGITTAMRRAMNNRSLIGRFKQVLCWSAAKSGKSFFEYPETGTTRTCHKDGYVVEGGIAPNVRVWSCPRCGSVHIRDENAALNGLKVVREKWRDNGRDLSLLVPGSGLVSVRERWAWRVRPSGVHCSPRGTDGGSTARVRKSKRGCDNPRPIAV